MIEMIELIDFRIECSILNSDKVDMYDMDRRLMGMEEEVKKPSILGASVRF